MTATGRPIGTVHIVHGRIPIDDQTDLPAEATGGDDPGRIPGYWTDHHGPLIAKAVVAAMSSATNRTPRPLDSYRDDNDRSGYDGVTVQWFASMDEYQAHMNEVDSPLMFADIPEIPRPRPPRVRADRRTPGRHRRCGRLDLLTWASPSAAL